jgi:hypothetical protein
MVPWEVYKHFVFKHFVHVAFWPKAEHKTNNPVTQSTQRFICHHKEVGG